MKLVPQAENEKQKMITEARQIHFAAPFLFPMLERRKDNAIRRIISGHREAKFDHQAVAELYIVESLLTELKGKLLILHGESKGD